MNLVEELSKYKLALQEDNFIASDGDNSGFGNGWNIDSDKVNEPPEDAYNNGWNDAIVEISDFLKKIIPE